MKRRTRKKIYMITQVSSMVAVLVMSIPTGSFASDAQEMTDNIIKTSADAITSSVEEYEEINDEYFEMQMPNVQGERKTWLDYRTITSKISRQYELQQGAWTDENGLRRYGEHYMVALGTAYGSDIGAVYRITFENGTVFTAVLGDIKADIHTDSSNMYIEHNGNIVEFIVDSKTLYSEAKYHGDISYIEGFDSAVVKIEKKIN